MPRFGKIMENPYFLPYNIHNKERGEARQYAEQPPGLIYEKILVSLFI